MCCVLLTLFYPTASFKYLYHQMKKLITSDKRFFDDNDFQLRHN
ncbi:hypothetical protein AC21_4354 [Escherichia coli 2-474-04_S3_C2]|nr:hypothetical protein AB92_4348 [Escherichia coli 2-474-04_S3_C1]KDY89239.1 hypothetical protein AC21_4354 [Escherichia coli 2-474-04_S3_C2]